MATINPNTLITTKVLINDTVRRFKIQIKDLGPNTFPGKLKELLLIPASTEVLLERYSDSAGSYVVLDSNKPAVYKQLYRAAKAKLKLRIKVTLPNEAVDMNAGQITQSDRTLPAYASQVTLPLYPTAPEPAVAPPEATPVVPVAEPEPEVPLEQVVTNAVVAYLDGEEGRSKLRATISEEVDKKMAEQKTVSVTLPPLGQAYAVYCNSCEKNVEEVHYHCSICDHGDFDLCQNCFTEGRHCKDESHWMIKRRIKDGEIISSTTESIRVQKKKNEPEPEVVEDEAETERYCNDCCEFFPDHMFVTCQTCDDYDLCIGCHVKNEHGHHPGHAFQRAIEGTELSNYACSLLPAGRGLRHSAICDGCQKQIIGVRHKCLACPDWDYCSACILNANVTHPGHRFAPIYESLKCTPVAPVVRHYGVYCDGSLCKARQCITGARYKCAICPDFDLCSACEASPSNTHNPSHPLIKFKTAVRHVTVQTLDDAAADRALGDKFPAPSTITTSPTSNAATQVHTVADIEPLAETSSTPDATYNGNLVASIEKSQVAQELNASFIAQQVMDGSEFSPCEVFTQVWTLCNKGEVPWPKGVGLEFSGGDLMQFTNATVIRGEVPVGGIVHMSVDLIASSDFRYQIGYWKLVAPDGTRFGPSLWCDIRVSKEKPVETESKEKPEPQVAEIKSESDSEPEARPEPEVAPELEVRAEPEVEEIKAESEVKVDEPEGDEDLLVESTSQMIFPQLEKESPVPSVSHSAANISESHKPIEQEQAAPALLEAPPSSVESSLSGGEYDDVTSETLSYNEDLEDHFISDDEDYEVLMASDDDEEFKNA